MASQYLRGGYCGARRELSRRPRAGAQLGGATSQLSHGRTQLHAFPYEAWNPAALASASDMYFPCFVVP
jgi:hypothetical protein